MRFDITQNTSINQLVSVTFECEVGARITWYQQREDTYGTQPKIDRLLDDLGITNDADRMLGVTVHLQYRKNFGDTENENLDHMQLDYGLKNIVVQAGNQMSKTPYKGFYTLNVFGYASVISNKSSIYTLDYSDIKPVVEMGGVLTTFAVNFRRDPNLPDPEVCVPEYFYYVDKTNIDFGTVPSTFFDGGNRKQEDIHFRLVRKQDPNCDEIEITPKVKIEAPFGEDVLSTSEDKSILKNGTMLSLVYLDDKGDKPMNYNQGYDMGKIGGKNQWDPLDVDRYIRVIWSKADGQTVKSGRWNATMKYEIYFP
ncbi:hypothetical protein MMG00_06290 [Ignatzschineria rhizosphaerae]|uniref:Fimbrial-type adhesion domain-containing protein n=1 Tax=Ignatzschineria rhizosphaerae TaxID=2923279 RepID=A0ABY3X3I9_9GAMM|nr:hypothetical protein [Ignatzschineria rhizosphaerae]UNM97449.1 hypothetical protein MMG00_06290 [Ignatzschineria rhizosphaerae]